MKHILLIFACLLTFGAQAQTGLRSQLTGTAHDTLTNTATDTLYFTVKGPKNNVTFQYNIDKVSGTVGGTIVCAGSIDESKYVTLNSHTIADADANAGYSMSTNGYRKYRVIVTTSGTQVSAYDIWGLYH